MEIRWVRGNEYVSFNRPHVWFCLGVRGSGKSSFLESLAMLYLNQGHAILDLFGSRDGEGLAWLRSPYAKDKRVLLLRGEAVDVSASWPVKKASALTLKDLSRYDIIVSASPLYLGVDDEFLNAAQITDKVYKRLHWKRLIFCLVREAANFYYSRLKVTDNQIFAKSQMVYLIREGRHVGLSLGLDSVRFYSIDIDVRSISDFMVLKSQGMFGLSRDLHFLYSFFEPHVVRNMPPQFFFILSRGGAVGVGEFKEVPWHKREKENILKAVGIKCEYGEPIEVGEYRGTFKTVGDREHAEIVRLYVEEGLSTDRIAEKLKRSTRTPHKHIKRHNRAVERSSFCPACRRVKSKYDGAMAVRG